MSARAHGITESVVTADEVMRVRTDLLPPHAAADPASADLGAVNHVVGEAVRSWNLPARVLRLALPSLLYTSQDLAQMSAALAARGTEPDDEAVGVAVWESADGDDVPAGGRAILLHGLYVVPRWQRRGVGGNLLEFVSTWAESREFDAIVLRAWRESERFFRAHGFRSMHTGKSAHLHPRRLYKALR